MTMPSLPNRIRTAVLAGLLALGSSASAQDGTIYPLAAPAEPNAIALGTGGVEGQTAKESWFRQWGDPMARSGSADALATPHARSPCAVGELARAGVMLRSGSAPG